MDTDTLTQLITFIPLPAIGIGALFAAIVGFEGYLYFRGKNREKKPEANRTSEDKHDEIDLKPLKFPEVPLQVSPSMHPRKMTMVVASILVLILLGGAGTVYLSSSGTSLFSLGQSQDALPVEVSVPTQASRPSPTRTPELLPTATVPPSAPKVELIYYWVVRDNWDELTSAEVLELPPSQNVSIAVFTNTPHIGARFFINGRVYTTDPEEKNPFGYFYVVIPRSSFTRLSDISVSLLQ